MDCEVLLPRMSWRGRRILQAMIDAAPKAGVRCIVTERYQRRAPVLMSYGLGHPQRKFWTDAHVAGGGRLIGWDLGYWARDAAMRVTVDEGHPQRHLRDMPPDRWESAGITLRNDWDPDGPIVLIGIGRKSRAQFGLAGQEWEQQQLAAIRKAYPGRRVLYRPKRHEVMPGVSNAEGTIDQAIAGASLVVCRHSNVAVDACIAGVPVVCWDGAAAALYGSDLLNPVMPDEMQRRRFLQNLAWWQWQPKEAAQAWRFLLTVCA